MPISVYQASVESLRRALENLKNILNKGAEHAEKHNIDPLVLTHMRLFPDMLPLYSQVAVATDLCGRCVARLAGLELPRHDDTELGFAELIERVDKTLIFIGQVGPEKLEGADQRMVQFRGGGRTHKAKGTDYLLIFILPNVYFHVTTIYNILRHSGVELTKKDYTGEL